MTITLLIMTIPVVNVVQYPLMIVRAGFHTRFIMDIFTLHPELLQIVNVNLPDLFPSDSFAVFVSLIS